MSNYILAIDTSCDETSAAVTDGRRVLSNVISSQINIHKKYGGVFPALAKRAHQEKIDYVVGEALKRALIVIARNPSILLRVNSVTKQSRWASVISSGLPRGKAPRNDKKNNSQLENWKIGKLSAVAVTQGPGLAIALEVGIKKAKELFTDYGLQTTDHRNLISAVDSSRKTVVRLIAVNHLEGHLYSCLAQNANGLPKREIQFPALGLIVSGGHTQLVLMKDHGKYEILGSTLDDACGEALDKAAKILKLGYPGGPIIERLAEEFRVNPPVIRENHEYKFTPPLREKANLNFSYSGLKTQFLYLVEKMSEEEFNQNLRQLAFDFQSAAFEQIIRKTSQAIKIYQPKTLLCGGGVIANKTLRRLLRGLAKENHLPVLFPPNKKLITDNAAMVGIAAGYKLARKEFVEDIESLDRKPRMAL